MKIHPSVYIAPNATLVGNIEIGQDSSVWFGTVIRADRDKITIGEGSNIQDLSMLHVDPSCPINIGNQVIIGHRAIIHGCTIKDHTLIGMGAIIMNHVVIGSYCIVGAGALVTKGMHIPDYSVVMGVPAKITGRVTPEEIVKLKLNALSYIKLADEYKKNALQSGESGL
ncbi:MAG: gamma carbonic anhydrase family protein [Bacteroidetes bacterium]|nr:gamma carbonic anhydrase family protein [Bacteroidota bacterium]